MRSDELFWGKLDRAWLAEQAQSGRLPDWQRVAFAAWHRVSFDGIARFAAGELAEVAAKVDPRTGEVLQSVANVRRAIRTAAANGWLGAGSTEREVRVRGDTYAVGRG